MGAIPVVGELGRGTGRCGTGEVGPLREDSRQTAVQANPRAGQQIPLDRLREERVTEADALVVGVEDEDRPIDGLPQRRLEASGRSLPDKVQELAVHWPACDRGDSSDLAGGIR